MLSASAWVSEWLSVYQKLGAESEWLLVRFDAHLQIYVQAWALGCTFGKYKRWFAHKIIFAQKHYFIFKSYIQQ